MSMFNRLSSYLNAALARFAEAFPETFWYALDAGEVVDPDLAPEDYLPPRPVEPLRPDRLTDQEALIEIGRQTYQTLRAVCASEFNAPGGITAVDVPHAYERAMEYAARDPKGLYGERLADDVKFRDGYARLIPAGAGGVRSNPIMVYDRDELRIIADDDKLQPDSDPDHARPITH